LGLLDLFCLINAFCVHDNVIDIIKTQI